KSSEYRFLRCQSPAGRAVPGCTRGHPGFLYRHGAKLRMTTMTRCLRNLLLATTALLPLGIGFAVANPLGGNVVGGGATINGQGSANVTVNQSTQNAIINWNSFNIGAGETTHFNQPNSSAVVLNRVTGGLGPSQIFGTLSANGNVSLVNRDG